MTTSTDTRGRYARLNDAMKATRKAGVRARRNVSGCCRSCIVHDDNKGVGVWHYGGQGFAIAEGWDGDIVRPSLESYSRGERSENPSFNFADVADAEVFAAALRAEGLEVDWDGTIARCVTVGAIAPVRTFTYADFDVA